MKVLVTATCPCGTTFETDQKRIEDGHGRYCSKPCMYKYRVRPSGLKYEIKMVNAGWIKTTHGLVGTPTYKSWSNMKDRCYNSNDSLHYPHYGGRGIQVCESWRESYLQFLSDMGERPVGKTLDRINNDGNYEPTNCRWATPKEQSNNRRDPWVTRRKNVSQ